MNFLSSIVDRSLRELRETLCQLHRDGMIPANNVPVELEVRDWLVADTPNTVVRVEIVVGEDTPT